LGPKTHGREAFQLFSKQFRKVNSPKFTVANGPSGASPSSRLQHEGTTLASKRFELVAVVALVYQGDATRNDATTREILVHRTGTQPNFALTEF
jgi:hypothetical protein